MASDPPAPDAMLLGDRYRLEQVIGTGGMAIVWRAIDRRLGRHVAIKLIADTLVSDPAYLERFTREARTAAGLSHPNLVQVYDYAAAERPFLVMELVEGGTLADRIERGDVDGDEAATIARDLLSALDCVHRAGILHRDIKPANVLLGSDGRARLTDFGIAQPADATRLTQTGQLIGTLRYLASELVDGAPPSVRSDLYALGILIRELAGERLAGDLRELVDRLTDREPGRRPGSAGEARAMLRAAPDPPGETQPQPALPLSSRRAAAERQITPPAVPVIVAAIAVLLVVAFVLSLDAGDGTRAADTTTGAAAAGQPPITLEGRLDQLDRIIRGEGP